MYNVTLSRISKFTTNRQFLDYILVGIGGLSLSYAQAPNHHVWLLPIVYSLVYYLSLKASSFIHALTLGFIFSFSYLAHNSLWIANALSVDEIFVWVIPFALLGIPAYMSLFTAICPAILYLNKNRRSITRLFIFASSWAVMESLRSQASFGFSMSSVGYIASFSDTFAQSASIFGVYGLSFFIIALSTVTAEACLAPRVSILWVSGACLILGATYIWGNHRIISATPSYDYNVKLRIVQGGFTPHQLWRMEQSQNSMVRKYLELSMKQGYEDITHFIWGESTLPVPVNIHKTNLLGLVNMLPNNSFLLTGSPRIDSSGVFNSWVAVDNSTGLIKAHYDKSRLVPFGEFLPFRSTLTKLFRHGGLNGVHDYTPGTNDLNVISINNTPNFHVVICYETMFFGKLLSTVNSSDGGGLRWIVNITNDGWFGSSDGPYQHLAVAKLRAIESGLPFIRSTNTGVSAVYDGHGRLISSIPFGTEGTIDVYLPQDVAKTMISTIHKYTNRWIEYAILLMILVVTVHLWWSSRRASEDSQRPKADTSQD